MAERNDMRFTLLRGALDIGFHAVGFALVFWSLMLVGEFTTNLLGFASWAYFLGLYVRVSRRLSADDGADSGKPSPLATIGGVAFKWLVAFPLAITGINLAGLWALGTAVNDPTLQSLPVIEQVAANWTALYVSGLSAMIVYTTIVCVFVGVITLVVGRSLDSFRSVDSQNAG